MAKKRKKMPKNSSSNISHSTESENHIKEKEKTPINELSWKYSLLLGILAGVILPFAYPKYDIFPLAFIAMIPLLYIAEKASKKQAFLCGWIAGFLTNFIGYSFLTITLERFGGFPYSLAVLGAVLLSLYQGARTGLFVLFVNILRRRGWPLWLVAPVTLVSLELLIPFLFTAYLANALYLFHAYIQIADIGSVFIVSAAVILANVFFYEIIQSFWQKKPFDKKLLGTLLAVQIVILGYGFWRISNTESIAKAAPARNIGIIQPNFGIDTKGKINYAQEQLTAQIKMSQELVSKGADLIVWPETSYPYALPRDMKTLPEKQKLHHGFDTPILFGAVTQRVNQSVTPNRFDVYNSAFLVTSDNQIQGRYDKNFLVWFSEVLPFSGTFPILDEWFPNGSNFRRGNGATLIPFDAFQIAPNICNDDIMPAHTLRLKDKPANLMVNITNDAWFGNTAEPFFHLALATFRSVENHLYMVRATNTGISSLVDPSGRVVEQTPITLDTDQTIAEVWEVKMMPSKETWFRTLGNAFAWICFLLFLPMLFVKRTALFKTDEKSV